MGMRAFAWGIPLWGAAPLVVTLAVTGPIDQWDMSMESALSVLVGLVAAFAAAGAIVWMPASVWLDRASRRVPWAARALLFAGLGFAIGATVVIVLVLASGNATWPHVLGPILEIAGTATGASLGGWLLAIAATAAKRWTSRPTVQT